MLSGAMAATQQQKFYKIENPETGRVEVFDFGRTMSDQELIDFASGFDWKSFSRSNWVDKAGKPVKIGPEKAPPAAARPRSSRVRAGGELPAILRGPGRTPTGEVDAAGLQGGLERDGFRYRDPKPWNFLDAIQEQAQATLGVVPELMTSASRGISKGVLGEDLDPKRIEQSRAWNQSVQFLIPGVNVGAAAAGLTSIAAGLATDPSGTGKAMIESVNVFEPGLEPEDIALRGFNGVLTIAGGLHAKGKMTEANIRRDLMRTYGMSYNAADGVLAATRQMFETNYQLKGLGRSLIERIKNTISQAKQSEVAHAIAQEFTGRVRQAGASAAPPPPGFITDTPDITGQQALPPGGYFGARPNPPGVRSLNKSNPPLLDPTTGAPLGPTGPIAPVPPPPIEPMPSGGAPAAGGVPPVLNPETGLPAAAPEQTAPAQGPSIIEAIDDAAQAVAGLQLLFGGPKAPEATAAPAKVPPKAPAPRQNTEGIEWVDPDSIGVRPDLQYKQVGITDRKANVTSKMKKLTEYDVPQGGVIAVLEDEGGARAVVHGHHRLDLAKRAERFIEIGPSGETIEVPRQIPVRVLKASEGWTPAAARAYGAIENVRNGDGTAIDAAMALHDLGVNRTTALNQLRKWQINMTQGLGQRVVGLLSLPTNELGKVRNGAVPEDVAAGIGSVELTDPQYVAAINAVQDFIADEKVRAREKPATFEDGRVIAEKIRRRGLQAVEDPNNQGGFDFGAEFEQYISTVVQEQAIEREVGRELKGQKSLIAAGIRAEELEGENIDKGTRAQMVEALKGVESKLELLFRHDQEVQNALKTAAERYATKQIALDQAVDEVVAIVKQQSGRSVLDIIGAGNRPAETDNAPAPEGAPGGGDQGVAAAPTHANESVQVKDLRVGDHVAWTSSGPIQGTFLRFEEDGHVFHYLDRDGSPRSETNFAYSKEDWIGRAGSLQATAKTDEELAAEGLRDVFGSEVVREKLALLNHRDPFLRWFKGSAVVDKYGLPQQVYHGTPSPALKDEFARDATLWFTDDPTYAATFARPHGSRVRNLSKKGSEEAELEALISGEGARIYPVYLKITKPLNLWQFGHRIRKEEILSQLPEGVGGDILQLEYFPSSGELSTYSVIGSLSRNRGIRENFDGIIYKEDPTIGSGQATGFVVWTPTQIKSAVANRGTFAPDDASILRSPIQAQMEELWGKLSPEQQGALVRIGVGLLGKGVTDSLDFFAEYQKLTPDLNIPPPFILYIQRKAREQYENQASQPEPKPAAASPGGGSKPGGAGSPGTDGAGAGSRPASDKGGGVRTEAAQKPGAGGAEDPTSVHGTHVGITKIITARPDLTQPSRPDLIPADLIPFLDDHQQHGVSLGIQSIESQSGFLLIDGTGVGKTRQLLAIAEYFRRKGHPVLIVAPANVLERSKGQSYYEDPRKMGITLEEWDSSQTFDAGTIRTMSYNAMERASERGEDNRLRFPSAPNMIVILDEAHNIKRGHKGAWGEAGLSMVRNAAGILYATATLADKLTHIEYLAEIGLVPGAADAAEAMWRIGFQPAPGRDGWNRRRGYSWETIYNEVNALFNDMIARGMMIKREISLEGVPIAHEVAALPPGYDEMETAVDNATKFPPARAMHKRFHLDSMMAPEAARLAAQEVKEGRQVILFVQTWNPHVTYEKQYEDGVLVSQTPVFTTESAPKVLRNELGRLGIHDVVEVHGGVTDIEIDQGKQDFQSGAAKVLIATTAKGGTGLNFDDREGDKPRTMIFVTPPYSGIEFMQAIGRVWRLTTRSIPKILLLANEAEVTIRALGIIEDKIQTLGATSKTTLAKHPLFIRGMEEAQEIELGATRGSRRGNGDPLSEEDRTYLRALAQRLSGYSAIAWGLNHMAENGVIVAPGEGRSQLSSSAGFMDAQYGNALRLSQLRPDDDLRVSLHGDAAAFKVVMTWGGREVSIAGDRSKSGARNPVIYTLEDAQSESRPADGTPGAGDPGETGRGGGATQPPGRHRRRIAPPVQRLTNLRETTEAPPSAEHHQGRLIAGLSDLADIAQDLRDPQRETQRVFFVDAAGRVLRVESFSSFDSTTVVMPYAKSKAGAFYLDRMRRYGASGFYLLHNHPSSSPKPSQEDISTSKSVQAAMSAMGWPDAFLGHVIIDGTRYGWIAPDGAHDVEPLPADLIAAAKEFHISNQQPTVTSYPDAAIEAKRIIGDSDQVVIIGRGGPNGAHLWGLWEMPVDDFRDLLNQSPARFLVEMRKLKRQTGSARLALMLPATHRVGETLRNEVNKVHTLFKAAAEFDIFESIGIGQTTLYAAPPREGYLSGARFVPGRRVASEIRPLQYKRAPIYVGKRLVFRTPRLLLHGGQELLIEGLSRLQSHRHGLEFWEGPDEPYVRAFLKRKGWEIDHRATRNFNAWNNDENAIFVGIKELSLGGTYKPAEEFKLPVPEAKGDIDSPRSASDVEDLFAEDGADTIENLPRITELAKIAQAWNTQFGGGYASAARHLKVAWGATPPEIELALDLIGLRGSGSVLKQPKGGLFGPGLDAELQGQGSLLDLLDGTDSVHETIGPLRRDQSPGERNLSTMLAFRNRLQGNLSQLSSRWPSAAQGARRAANSTAQVMLMIRNAVPQIEAAGVPWEMLGTVLSESRLRGIERRWWDLARKVSSASDDELRDAYLGGLRGAAGALRSHETADAMFANGNVDDARDFLYNVFVDAAERVTHLMTDAEFRAAIATEAIQDGIIKYKELLETQLAEIHSINEGVFSDALGPLDTYYPLSAMREDETLISRTRDRFRRYRKPKNPSNYFATGLASGYDVSIGAFAQKLEVAVRTNNVAHLLQLLEDNRLLRKLTPKERRELGLSPVFTIGGIEYKAVIEEIRPPRTVIRDGRTIEIPNQVAVMPEWLWKELENIVRQKSRQDMGGWLTGFLGLLNSIGMAGPLDAVFHTSNVIGALVSGTPYAGTGWLSKSIGNTPVTKIFTAIANIIHTDPNSPEALAELMDMAKNGELPNRYGTETISKAYAEATGAKQRVLKIPMPHGGSISVPYTFGPLLYGPSGLDIRARLLMRRIAKAFKPNATSQELFDFTSQLGVYVRGLESDIVRWSKDTQVAPFATAGSTMFWNGVEAWTLTGPTLATGGGGGGGRIRRGEGRQGFWRDPKRNAKFRAAQQLSAGATGLIAIWIAVYYLYHGRFPWEDPDSRLLELPLKPEHRNSKLGRAIFGDDASTGYVSFGFFAPMVMRGSRSIGLKGAYNTAVLGGTPGQAAETAFRDSINSMLHPWTSGPAAQGLFTMATGAEPYIIGTRDLQGNYSWKLIQTVPKKEPGLDQIGTNVLHGLFHVNTFAEEMMVAAGALEVPEWMEGREPTALRAIADLVFPRLIGTEQNTARKSLSLQRGLLESRTSREGRRTRAYQRRRRALTPGG